MLESLFSNSTFLFSSAEGNKKHTFYDTKSTNLTTHNGYEAVRADCGGPRRPDRRPVPERTHPRRTESGPVRQQNHPRAGTGRQRVRHTAKTSKNQKTKDFNAARAQSVREVTSDEPLDRQFAGESVGSNRISFVSVSDFLLNRLCFSPLRHKPPCPGSVVGHKFPFTACATLALMR